MSDTEPIVGNISVDKISPGGSDPQCFDWQEAWYPVHYLEDLDKSKPTPLTVLGKDIVIWWDKQAKSWRIFTDQCPHRLAPLSEGRINNDGLLECPYHGCHSLEMAIANVFPSNLQAEQRKLLHELVQYHYLQLNDKDYCLFMLATQKMPPKQQFL
ncbi:Rieske 2Fe-2S domain-containing protein [Halotia branconii]|uniref:Rieske 2Fe-2S domain-containing protein n=1 Tax=Halotia branconii TaxID=1620816 RepID=UPI0031B8724A